MAFIFDEVQVNDGQFFVAENGKNPKALGEGEKKVKHSAYIEGPLQVGNSDDFSVAEATVMIGKDGNAGAVNALFVKGNVTIVGNTKQEGDTDQVGSIKASGSISASNLYGLHP